MRSKSPIRKNQAYWNQASDAYQRDHGAGLEREAFAWGVWRIPEAELGVLGDPAGRDVLELGCGAAQWSVALARAGARAIGIDLSRQQLRHAAARAERLGAPLPLAAADAERLPFRDASFDVVFCDHGATSWARPGWVVPEAARLLRAGGVFAFCMSTPIRDLCWDAATDRISPRLLLDYFGLERLEDDRSVSFQLPYGEWIRLFRRCSLAIEDLIELRAPPDASTTYAEFVPVEWARRWPAEHVWKLRKLA